MNSLKINSVSEQKLKLSSNAAFTLNQHDENQLIKYSNEIINYRLNSQISSKDVMKTNPESEQGQTSGDLNS